MLQFMRNNRNQKICRLFFTGPEREEDNLKSNL